MYLGMIEPRLGVAPKGSAPSRNEIGGKERERPADDEEQERGTREYRGRDRLDVRERR